MVRRDVRVHHGQHIFQRGLQRPKDRKQVSLYLLQSTAICLYVWNTNVFFSRQLISGTNVRWNTQELLHQLLSLLGYLLSSWKQSLSILIILSLLKFVLMRYSCVSGKITWRDAQHLVVWTSSYEALKENHGWQRNSQGFLYSTKFGFGLMNATAIVQAAEKWVNVPPKSICVIDSITR